MTGAQRFLPKEKWLDGDNRVVIEEGSRVKWTNGKSRYRGTVVNITDDTVFVQLHPQGVVITTNWLNERR